MVSNVINIEVKLKFGIYHSISYWVLIVFNWLERSLLNSMESDRIPGIQVCQVLIFLKKKSETFF